jgi:hypothetical protein
MPVTISRRSALIAGLAPLAASAANSAAEPDNASVEKWGVFETSFHGPETGNPFLTPVSAEFRHEHRTVTVAGFYDGDGTFRVRFMPDAEGDWTYTVNGQTGRFVCTAPAAGNHGPVTVRDTYHFGYADGSRYSPFGTTCYAWAHQGDALEEQTLATLRRAPFNKMRMCVFPKWYAYNQVEPQFYPFPRSASGENDVEHFDPRFFQHFERRVAQLCAMGVEADLILFHPYDHWGYASLPPEVNDRYLRYTVARLSAYRNVWWSMANEWDFVKSKTLADWDRFFRIVEESDPYHHLRGIHNGAVMYDHARPWVTHASIQSDAFEKTPAWRAEYRKPIVFDECKYEGNIPKRWGDISAREMVRRFWLGTALGAWVGHGETYLNPKDVLWWSKGGELHGESAPRIAFLRKLIEEMPEMEPLANPYFPTLARAGACYLTYLDYHRPAEYVFELPAAGRFSAEVIDPWEMKITPVAGTFSGKAELKLPGEPHLAVRFQPAKA